VTITIKPLEELTKDLKSIDYKDLQVRLTHDRKVEEINLLASGINEMMERLERSSSFQKDFIHYASHELRTPLAAMISITENALHNNSSQVQLIKAMRELFQQQKDLVNITNSLLYLSDSKFAQEGLEFNPVRLDETVFHSAEIMKNYFPDAQIEVQLEGDIANPDFFVIAANEPLLMIAFNNLLKNALQYSTDRSAKIKIHFTEQQRGVRFINRGDPIREPYLGRIFTPFYRSGNSSGIKGSGLGLALVYQAAKLHNAEISYTYKDGANIFNFLFTVQNISLLQKPIIMQTSQ
jgi:signal transduction histidine kinase